MPVRNLGVAPNCSPLWRGTTAGPRAPSCSLTLLRQTFPSFIPTFNFTPEVDQKSIMPRVFGRNLHGRNLYVNSHSRIHDVWHLSTNVYQYIWQRNVGKFTNTSLMNTIHGSCASTWKKHMGEGMQIQRFWMNSWKMFDMLRRFSGEKMLTVPQRLSQDVTHFAETTHLFYNKKFIFHWTMMKHILGKMISWVSKVLWFLFFETKHLTASKVALASTHRPTYREPSPAMVKD